MYGSLPLETINSTTVNENYLKYMIWLKKETTNEHSNPFCYIPCSFNVILVPRVHNPIILQAHCWLLDLLATSTMDVDTTLVVASS